MIRRFAAGAAMGTAVVLSATGCLGDDGGGKKAGSGGTEKGGAALAAVQIMDKVSQKTGQIRTFRARLSSTTSMSGQRTRTTAVIAYRVRPRIAMKMVIPQMTMNGRSMSGMQEILVGDSMYLKAPAFARRTGKPWLRIRLSRLSARTGIDYKSLMNQSQQADPAANVRMLTASKDVRKVGEETVGGVATTHYQGTYSVQEALAKLGADKRSKMQEIIGRMGLDRMSFDLWVDGRQLPRKMTVKSPAGAKMQMAQTMTYSGFNAPVSIAPPPAGLVSEGR